MSEWETVEVIKIPPKPDDSGWETINKISDPKKEKRMKIVEALGPIEDKPKTRDFGVLDVLNAPNDLVKVGVDALFGPDKFKDLYQKYKTDKNYIPGDVLPEKVSDNPYIQTAIKMGEDIGLDPLTLAGFAVEKLGPAALKAGAGGSKYIEMGMAKALGSLGDVFTQGQITRKGMKAAVEHFTPAEQMMAKTTLEKAGELYGPKKATFEKMEDIWHSVRGHPNVSLNDTPDAAIVLPDEKFKSTLENFSIQMRKLLRQGKNPAEAQALLKQVDDIAAKGETFGPELAGVLDGLNSLEYTPLDNKRSIADGLGHAFHETRDSVTSLLKKSSPEFAGLREKYSAAKQMNMGRAGGHLTEMVRKGMANTMIRKAADSLVSGKSNSIIENLTALAAHYPEPWNAAVATLRVPPNVASLGMEATAKWISENPKAANGLYQILVQQTKGNAPLPYEGISLNPLPDNSPLVVPPENAQSQFQPAPMIDPKDAELMQKTGLTSVQGGIIQDQNEKIKFLDQIQHNPALNHAQKTKLRLIVIRTGRIPDPSELTSQ